MSTQEVRRFLHLYLTDPQLRRLAESDLAAALKGFDVTDFEHTLIESRDPRLIDLTFPGRDIELGELPNQSANPFGPNNPVATVAVVRTVSPLTVGNPPPPPQTAYPVPPGFDPWNPTNPWGPYNPVATVAVIRTVSPLTVGNPPPPPQTAHPAALGFQPRSTSTPPIGEGLQLLADAVRQASGDERLAAVERLITAIDGR